MVAISRMCFCMLNLYNIINLVLLMVEMMLLAMLLLFLAFILALLVLLFNMYLISLIKYIKFIYLYSLSSWAGPITTLAANYLDHTTPIVAISIHTFRASASKYRRRGKIYEFADYILKKNP